MSHIGFKQADHIKPIIDYNKSHGRKLLVKDLTYQVVTVHIKGVFCVLCCKYNR